MKEFLLNTLRRLWALTGYDQIEALDNNVEIINELIKELLSECNKFNISIEVKQKIIEQGLKDTYSQPKSFKGLNVALISTWMKQYIERNPCTGKQPPISEAQQREFDKIEADSKAAYAEKLKENPNYNPEQEFFDMMKNIGKLPRQVKHKPRDGNVEDIDYKEV